MKRLDMWYLIMSVLLYPAIAWSQATEYGSYITTTNYLNSTGSRSLQQRVYDNGLGDVLQEIQVGITPSGHDLAVYHEYDQYRRESKVWLPYVRNGNGAYTVKSTLTSGVRNYYSDTYPYSETQYEAFTGSRPSYQYKPGQQRHNNQKRVTTSYYKESGRHFLVPSQGYLGISSSYEYVCTKTMDEDGRISIQKCNATGRLLIETRADGSTAYVYDHKGNLCYVLPPLLYDYLSTVSSITIADSDTKMKQYAYIYRYDDQNHCIYKKLPGCEPVYYIFDKAGNCILSQDGVLRSSGLWIYTIPDKFGRPCISGHCRNSLNYASHPLHGVWVCASYTGATNSQMGYTVSGLTLSSPVLLSAIFYDNYTFVGRNGCPSSLAYSSTGIGQYAQNIHRGLQTGGASSYENPDGSVAYNYAATYYDSRFLPVQVRNTNALGGINILTTSYTYSGDIDQQYVRITTGSTDATTVLRAEYQNIYSALAHNNQLQHCVLKLKTASGGVIYMDTIQSLTYNDLGQVATLKRSGHRADMSYEYDLLQGHLKGISSNCGFVQAIRREDDSQQPLYNGSISSMDWHCGGESTLHSYQYQYDGYNRLTSATYSESSYSAAPMREVNDESLISLVPVPAQRAASATNKYGTSYTYDKHGNIKTLQRRGLTNSHSYGVIDNLSVTYTGNRRNAVSDAAGSLTYDGASDFVDGSGSTTEYAYDNNGRLTLDMNRGINNIQYDKLGNPKKMIFSGNRTIDYLYSSGGEHLRTIHRYPQNPNVSSSSYQSDTTDYICGLILKNRQPVSYQFAGGYISFSAANTISGIHYYVQDYQGNNRMVINRNATSASAPEQITHYYPYGGVIGDISTNENLQKFKFEGKELDRSFGLDNYDIHARNYFAMLPMWDRVDPLAEKYYGISPYVYCGGDPVNRGDYDGQKTVLFATQLPSDYYIPLATHTFIGVFDANNHCKGYYAYGGTEPASGQLIKQSYSQDYDVISSYENGKMSKYLKGNPFEIPVPEGMTQEEFDEKVIATAKNFGNVEGIQYCLYPGNNETQGNCNTSSTTLLIKAGVSKEQITEIEKKMEGIHWGFGDIKPWTKEEQENAVKDRKQQAKESIDRNEALQKSLM